MASIQEVQIAANRCADSVWESLGKPRVATPTNPDAIRSSEVWGKASVALKRACDEAERELGGFSQEFSREILHTNAETRLIMRLTQS